MAGRMRQFFQQMGNRFPLIKRFASDRKGVGAVEFALIFPVLMCLYFTAFELTIGFSMSKRTSRSASSIADIVSQQSSVTPTFLATMKDVVAATFAPYTANSLSLKITGVTLDSSGNPTVAWSWDQSGAKPYTVGSTVAVPTDMRSANSFLIRAEVSVSHQLFMVMPGLLPSSLQTITLYRQYYYRQRIGSAISCSGC